MSPAYKFVRHFNSCTSKSSSFQVWVLAAIKRDVTPPWRPLAVARGKLSPLPSLVTPLWVKHDTSNVLMQRLQTFCVIFVTFSPLCRFSWLFKRFYVFDNVNMRLSSVVVLEMHCCVQIACGIAHTSANESWLSVVECNRSEPYVYEEPEENIGQQTMIIVSLPVLQKGY